MCKVVPTGLIDALAEEYRAALAAEKAERERVSKAADAERKNAAGPQPHRTASRPDNRVKRCRAYLSKLEPSVEGQKGSDRMYEAARLIWCDFGLDECEGYSLLQEYNARAVPPWPEDGSQGLKRKWDEAVRAGGERGAKLKEDRPGYNAPTPSFGGAAASESPTNPATGAAADDAPPVLEEFFDPYRLGRLIVPVCGGVPSLVYYMAEWWRWQEGRYTVVPDDEMKTAAWAAVRSECEREYRWKLSKWEKANPDERGDPPKVRKVVAEQVSNALCAAASMCQVPCDVVWPVLLTSSPGGPGGLPALYPHPENQEFIAVTNGLIDVNELLATGRTELLAPTPMYLTAAALPVAFDPEALCPKFMAFLDRVTEGDGERQAVLQELMGYLLRFDMSQQAFFCLTGDGANGKSTFLAAKRAVLGDHNISSVPLETFGERFQLTSTLGKLVNAVAEVGEMDKVAEAFLKSFVAGDLMNFDRKNKSALNTRPTARLLLSCNALPRFTDRSEGVWRRFEVIPFTATITDKEKVKGMDKPEWWVREGEVPGILNWALVGLHRLYKQGGFTVSKVCEAAKNKHREMCNPHRMFLQELVSLDATGRVKCGELYAAYVEWCKQKRYMPLTDGNFGEEVRKVFRTVTRPRPRIEGKPTYVYQGVSWAHDRPAELLGEYDKKHEPKARFSAGADY